MGIEDRFQPQQYGRVRITTDKREITTGNVREVLLDAYTQHLSNRNRIKKISWWPSKIWYSDGSTCEDIEGRITMTSENGNIWD